MASFSKGTSFTDGVTGDVTAAKLHALVDAATPVPGFITDRTAETSIADDDLVLISDTSESGALNKMTVSNLMKAAMTGTINSTAGTITAATIPTLTAGTTTGTASTFTSGTITTLNSTTGTITTGVIPTLTSTTLITSGTGTAASPAIQPTGDTNTGIFFPAADTIAFSEGGTESMRIDSSGRVGIGTSSPAIAYRMSLTGDGSTIVGGLSLVSGGTTYIGAISSTSSDFEIFNASNGYVRIATNNTERLRIDSSGRVGIGTSSPKGRLEVSNTALSGETGAQCIFPLNVTIGNGGGSYGSIGYNLDYRSATGNITGVKYLVSDTISQLEFGAGGFIFRGAPVGTGGSTATLTEHLRIGSDGQIGIGGANYGTSGQVLTSNGSGSAPSWQTNAPANGSITYAKLSTSATEADNVAKRTAKAWVNFNGQGTVSIRSSFNVSSITDNGTGDYTVNFTSALSDANYVMNVNISPQIGFLQAGTVNLFYNRGGDVRVAPTTTAARFSITGNVMDPQDACVSVIS